MKASPFPLLPITCNRVTHISIKLLVLCLLPAHSLEFFNLRSIPSKSDMQVSLAVRSLKSGENTCVVHGVWLGKIENLEVHLH